ncbi:hypothetical protein ACHAQA_004174 [Verticillium albo-atrum]
MALTVKQLNADASILLTFVPITPLPIPGLSPKPFRILLDPWISGPSTVLHSMFSTATHKTLPCITTLQELPPIDLVIISQHKSDHCNEATLRQLPPGGTKTLILAEPTAAKVIRGWKYFDKTKVRTIPRWQDPKVTGKEAVVRVRVPPYIPGGEPGEVTVAFIPQKRDIKGLHAAIGITYRQAPSQQQFPRLATPPETPTSVRLTQGGQVSPLLSSFHNNTPFQQQQNAMLPTPPVSPTTISLHPTRSVASLTPHLQDRPISVLFSPHGISYASLTPYATSHLVAEAALPLTCLLHCLDAVSTPWWLGGTISAGAPAGQETAAALGARAWISTHDGEKDIRGFVRRLVRTKRWQREQVEGVVGGVSKGKTEVVVLGVGEELILTSEGVWEAGEPDDELV